MPIKLKDYRHTKEHWRENRKEEDFRSLSRDLIRNRDIRIYKINYKIKKCMVN